MRRTAATLTGSFAVYVLVACGAATMDSDRGQSVDSGVGLIDSFIPNADTLTIADSLADVFEPNEARADDATTPPKPTVDVVQCDHDYPAGSQAQKLGWKYAEKAYPGRSKEDLSRVAVTWCTTSTTDYSQPPGYACYSGSPRVRDSAVAFPCDDPSTTTSVTFIAPPSL